MQRQEHRPSHFRADRAVADAMVLALQAGPQGALRSRQTHAKLESKSEDANLGENLFQFIEGYSSRIENGSCGGASNTFIACS
jgi:hypothetical protein